jgi:hypothetical protein
MQCRQALLSAVHCAAGDTLLCGLCESWPTYALHAVICDSESHCMRQSRAVPEYLHQAYEAAECFA